MADICQDFSKFTSMSTSLMEFFDLFTIYITRGHLQTMWTVFWGFLTPLPPCGQTWTFWEPPSLSMWIFQWPPSRFISKKIFKVPIYWKFKIQTYYKLFVEYLVPNTFILHSSLIQYLQIPEIKCKNVGIIIHMDRGLDPPSPHVDKHGHFGNPPSPLGCPHGL